MGKENTSQLFNKMKSVANGAVGTSKKIADSANNKIKEQNTKYNESKEAKRLLDKQAHNEVVLNVLQRINQPIVDELISELGDSATRINKASVDKMKKVFPIPKEHTILWADAEFDLRPSGIALTDYGLFIKTDSAVFANKKSKESKTQLLYFTWDMFSPGLFISDNEEENKVLLVDKKCSSKFIECCKKFSDVVEDDIVELIESDDIVDDKNYNDAYIIASAGVESAVNSVFTEQRAYVNTKAGHGEMAEEAITILDNLTGKNAKVVGRDNKKNGADRFVDGTYIQTKYYKSARGSLESSFNSDTGLYRYMDGSKPMQLEVPKDQYDKVLNLFKNKIEEGKVPGVTNPEDAAKYVRKGRLTYKQAVNLTKAGTVESLGYDIVTGTVTCSCALGISFISTAYFNWRETKDINCAVIEGMKEGTKVFGTAMMQHVMISQLNRSVVASALISPSRQIVASIGSKNSAKIVNSMRCLSGKSAIHGAAANAHLAKVMRSNAITTTVSVAVFSIPETYNLVSNKISGAQYTKNMSNLVSGVAGSLGATVVAGAASAKVAGVVGTTLAPGVGTVIGMTAGFIGGTAASAVSKKVGDVLIEDDIVTSKRLFDAILTCMITEYLFDSDEVDTLIKSLGNIKNNDMQDILVNLRTANVQEEYLRTELTPYFDSIILDRAVMPEITDENIAESIEILDLLSELSTV